jgi:hypothetical protein
VGKKRRTEKTVEIHQVYVVRQKKELPVLCDQCPTGEGLMLTPEEAAVVAGVSVRKIYGWVEAGVIHYRELSDGSLVVCLNSLASTEARVR